MEEVHNQKGNNKRKKSVIGFWICIIIAIVTITSSIVMISETKKVKNNDKEETTEKEEEEIKRPEANTNEGIIKDRTENGISFTETTLTIVENGSSFSTLVTNTTEEEIKVRVFEINFKNEKGEVITTLYGYIGGSLLANESRRISSNVDIELKEAVDIEYKIVV